MKKTTMVLAAVAAFLAAAAPAPAHKVSPWNDRGHGPTITCSDGEAQNLVRRMWTAGLEPYPTSQPRCFDRVNPTAVWVESEHYCICRQFRFHWTLVNYDAQHNRYPAYDNITWFTTVHVSP